MNDTRRGSPTKLGMEMEFWVVDERGELCDAADVVADHEQADPEFVGPLLEVQTGPHEREAALRRDLGETLESVLQTAAGFGKRLVPLGTPLTTADPPANGPRGDLYERIYGDGVLSAKNCAGMHVHFEKGAVERQLNLLTALDPALALVSSSPYYRGDRWMNSSRAAAYRTECGDPFERYCGLWPYVDSVAEWEDRVETAYGTFRQLAAERGVDPARVDDHFEPDDAVLNPVRLRQASPTVEWRAPDTTFPSQAVSLAFDVRRLVAQTESKPVTVTESLAETGVDADAIRVPTFEALEEVSDAAIRLGLQSSQVWSYLGRFGFDRRAYDPIAVEFGGPGTLRAGEARELRLAFADRLEADVATLTTEPSAERDRSGETVARLSQ